MDQADLKREFLENAESILQLFTHAEDEYLDIGENSFLVRVTRVKRLQGFVAWAWCVNDPAFDLLCFGWGKFPEEARQRCIARFKKINYGHSLSN